MRSSWLACFVAVVLAFGCGLAAGRWRWKISVNANKAYRALIIREHALQAPAHTTVVFGDSLIERQRLPEFCGPTLNAGISSITSGELLNLVADLMAIAHPARVVFNVGVNDVAQAIPVRDLQTNVERMIAASVSTGAVALVVGIPGGGVGNAELKAAASHYAARFIPYPVADQADTTDGLHLNARGAQKWQSAVRTALGCP